MNNVIRLLNTHERNGGGRAFPAFDSAPRLLLCSDYSGEHHGAAYAGYSYLLIDPRYLWLFDVFRRRLRSGHLGSRQFAFKKLRDRVRRRALRAFLTASNTLPGLLATFLVDQRLSLLDTNDTTPPEDAVVDPTTWKGPVFEKLNLIGHFGGLLFAGLSSPGQDLVWITDEDAIVANPKQHAVATRYLANVLCHYLVHDPGMFQLGTTRSDDGSLLAEDLAALPDLAAGALCEAYSPTAARSGFVLPLRANVSAKARTIASWLAGGYSLKKLVVTIDVGDEGPVLRVLDLHSNGYPFDPRPEIQRYFADKVLIPPVWR